MKLRTKTFIILLFAIIFTQSCETDEDEDIIDTSNPTDCNFTAYVGPTTCNDGFVAVGDDICCPSGFPFWSVGTSDCFSSCESALNSGATQIVKGNNGNNSGGGDGPGDAIFWINDDYGCGPVSVSLNGVGTSPITSFFTSTPNCGTNGGAVFSNLSPGNYSYTASCSGLTWSGSISINSNSCTTQLLLPGENGGGGGGGGGGGNGCDWTRGVDLLTVTAEVGTRCGSPTSYLMTVTNNSNIKLKTFICIRRIDGSYSGFGDGNGLDPGESTSSYICEGNGEYILFAEYFEIYLDNGNCNYGGCP